MFDEPGLPLPTSLEEVEALILALYKPGPPESIARIQEVLHRVQKSPEGWQLAQSLLVKQNDTIKFFGALTIIVKLNTESSALSKEDSSELLQNLIGWFVRSLHDSSGPMVTKKLCSALVTCFIQFPHQWPRCIKHLAYCLHVGHSVPVANVGGSDGSSSDGGGGEGEDVAALIAQLDFVRLRAALWFAATLVEETGKTDMNTERYMPAHTQLVSEGADVASLITRGLDPGFSGPDCIKVQEEAIKCLQPWIMYNQRISVSTDALTKPLRTLLSPTINCLLVDELYEASIELLADTLANYSGFFTGVGYEILYGLFETDWAQNRYTQLVQGGDFDFDSVQFGMLMIAFGDAKVAELLQSDEPRSRRILSGLSGLLAAEGYAVGEDRIFVPALEFWATFVETMADSMYGGDAEAEEEEAETQAEPAVTVSNAGKSWVAAALSLVMQVVGNCFKKIQYPPATVFYGWDSSDRSGFVEARKDVADLLQTVYAISGPALLSLFVDLLLRALPTQSWAELEAAAFCIGALSDLIPETTTPEGEGLGSGDSGAGAGGVCDALLGKVFSSSLFELLGQADKLPLRLRQTGLSLIEHYDFYFGRHGEFLPGALNLLFGAVGDPVLSGPSSRSICTLCSSCRSLLTAEAATFIAHLETIHASRQIDPLAEEKIVTAIAAVVQAIPDQGLKYRAFGHLFNIVKQDLDRALELMAHPERFEISDPMIQQFLRESSSSSAPSDSSSLLPPSAFGQAEQSQRQQPQQQQPPPSADKVAAQIAVQNARYLVSMAKGMQGTSEAAPIDLDGDTSTTTSNINIAAAKDVTNGGGPRAPSSSSSSSPSDSGLGQLQGEILEVLSRLRGSFPQSGEMVEAVCHVFRAGFSETEPGPFVFPADVISQFLTSQGPATPRIGYVVSTACAFASSLGNGRGTREMTMAQLARLLPWAVGLLQTLPEPEADTELSHNVIELVQRLVNRYPEVLMRLQPTSLLEFFFMFSLKVLNGREMLPKTMSADFWTTFISLKVDDPALHQSLTNVMEHLGPFFAESLIQNVGGNAARSELDKLSEPLRKLVVQHVKARLWLEAALFDTNFPSSRVSPEEKRMFLKKIISLRGARQTNQIVRDFWLACRGSSFAYAS